MDKLVELRNRAVSLGYFNEAKVLEDAITEIKNLRDELSKTQTELKAREEEKK